MNEYAGGSASHPALRRLWMVLLLGSLGAFGPLSIDMYLPALPSMTRDLHTGASLAQLTLTAFLLGLAVGQLFAGSQSDVRGRRAPLLVGLAGYTLSALACALVPSVWPLIFLRFIQGLGGSAAMVIALAVVRDQYSGPPMTKFLSLLMLFNGVGPVVAPIVGAQILRIATWRGIFFTLTGVGTLIFLAVLFGLPETLPVERRSSAGVMNTLRIYRGMILDRTFIGYALSQGLVAAAMFAYISGSPFVIQDIFGASPQLFSLFFAINGLGIVTASQVVGRLAGRVRETRLFVTGLGLASGGGAALLVVILAGGGLWGVLASLFVVVSSMGVVATAGSSLAMQNYGEAAGSASALLGLLLLGVGAVVAPLTGIGGGDTALPMGVVIAVTDVGGLLCYMLLRRGR